MLQFKLRNLWLVFAAFVNVPFVLDEGLNGGLDRFRQPSRGSGHRRIVCDIRVIVSERLPKINRTELFELRPVQQCKAVATRAENTIGERNWQRDLNLATAYLQARYGNLQ